MAETPYLADLIAHQLGPTPGSLILDYGCGIGRLAKALIELCGCHVIGVDISPEMRALAVQYVDSKNFSVVSPEVFQWRVDTGLRVDGAFAVWVLQHCYEPANDADLINRSLRDNGRVALVNSRHRVVPTTEVVWAQDGKDVRDIMHQRFEPLEEGLLDETAVGASVSSCSFWASYGRRSVIEI